MRQLKCFTLAAVAAFCLAVTAPGARAQVSFGIQIGSPPPCPYGYFDYPPYNCAPFGYYGPQWFPNGVFIGAGPWYHGDEDDFHGWVNRRYDPRYGYRGELPPRGERPDWDHHRGWERHFRGDDDHHEYREDRGNRPGEYDNRGGGRNNGYGRDNGYSRDNGYGNSRDNGRGGGHDNGGHGRDNGHDNGHHHDDDGH